MEQTTTAPEDDLAAIADCAFIRRHENLLIQRKVRLRENPSLPCPWKTGLHVRLQELYLNMNSFVEKVALSKLDGSYLRMITNLEKV